MSSKIFNIYFLTFTGKHYRLTTYFKKPERQMGTFTTKIKLGELGYVVLCNYNNYECFVKPMRVGKVQIEQVHPEAASFNDTPVYKETYMCFETGVGGGALYTYGEYIFSSKDDAENIGVIKLKQRMHKQIEERNQFYEKRAEEEKLRELKELEYLKSKYEGAS